MQVNSHFAHSPSYLQPHSPTYLWCCYCHFLCVSHQMNLLTAYLGFFLAERGRPVAHTGCCDCNAKSSELSAQQNKWTKVYSFAAFRVMVVDEILTTLAAAAVVIQSDHGGGKRVSLISPVSASRCNSIVRRRWEQSRWTNPIGSAKHLILYSKVGFDISSGDVTRCTALCFVMS